MSQLTGVYLKIDRAKQQCDWLEREVAAFLAKRPYTIFIETDPNTGNKLYRVRVHSAVPPQWSGPVGDIIHNLRSALDHLAVALVVLNGHTSRTAINDTYFPIGSSQEAFRTEKIRRAHPSAIRLIKRLKPYKGGITDFWRLHQMDILDKHSLIIPVGVAHAALGFRPRMKVPWQEEEVVFPMINLVPANRQYPLEDGAVIFQTGREGLPLEQPGDIQATFTIAFGEGQIVDGEPLVPTLRQFIGFIERVAQLFERKFFR